MSTESKFLIVAAIVTTIIIGLGIFFFSKNQKKPPEQNQKVDTKSLTNGAIHTKGDPSAKVVVVEFADLQCPACKAAQPIISDIVKNNSDKVYFVFRHYPLSVHKNAKVAAHAVEAAGGQGKFFEMVDLLYSKQTDWQNASNPAEKFVDYAQSLNLDREKFQDDMKKDYTNIDSDFALGNKSAVESTPTFFINGTKYPGVVQPQQFQQIIDSIMATEPQASTSATPGQ